MSGQNDQQPVYLLHGLLGTAYGHFSGQIRAWSGRYQVIPIDLPGHGRCRLDAGPDYLDTALHYVLALVERFGPGRLVAASYLGGPLATRTAAARPDLVRSLVLTGFAPGMDRDVFLTLLAGFGTLVDADAALMAEYDRLHGARWRATLAAFTQHVERAFETTALVRPQDLAALDVDTLLINGTLKSVERVAATDARRYGPRVRGCVLDGAGHIASHDAPEQFNEAVEAFWRKETAR
ncbi:Alpha/beta hydrolase family protein [Micromonospora sp. MW-13]|uniref:alpha/beta fold hydrolase n=1 Tax=Micromonospora sp. MW-13 TaxID=2094022 RepID=UPI000EBA5FF4|nr:alpha/beta fold hydrolase [Micromonospora sp. MW-13]RGC69589.1 Alpha/beta hydrolase family protein [Micromonospora sp. MW-13]